MKAHLSYLSYVLRHKWYVFVECCRLGIPWLGIVHDLSKFRPDEWTPYARHFYGKYPKWDDIKRVVPGYCGLTKEAVGITFDVAWLYHQKRNRHHWQYWLLIQDENEDRVLSMPGKYRREMLADWRGASQAKTGIDDTVAWYAKNKDKMQLHPTTRQWIEQQLEVEQ